MESSAYADNRCCHELYKLLETKAGEDLVGSIGFKFDDLSLFILGKTLSNRVISVKLAKYILPSDLTLNLEVDIRHSKPIDSLFLRVYKNAYKLKLNRASFENLMINELIDFFALNYQKFN